MKQTFEIRSLSRLLCAACAILAAGSLGAAELYWDGTNTGAGANGGSGDWQNSETMNWQTASSGGVRAPWTQGSNAVFGGTGGEVDLGSQFRQVPYLTFLSTDYTLVNGYLTSGEETTGMVITTAQGVTATIGAGIVYHTRVGTADIDKFGAGTLVLTGTNSFKGLMTIHEGTLRVANDAALGTTAKGTLVLSGATLELADDIDLGAEAIMLKGASSTLALRNVAGHNTASGLILIEGDATHGVGMEIVEDTSLELEGTIRDLGGNHPLLITGRGELILSGTSANTHLGLTLIDGTTVTLAKSEGVTAIAGDIRANDATLRLGASDQIGDGAQVSLEDSRFALAAFNESIGTLHLLGESNTITGTGTLTVSNRIDARYGEHAIRTRIAGDTAIVVKDGATLALLHPENTFTGQIDIANGELITTSAGPIGSPSGLGSGGTLPGANGLWLGSPGHTGTLTFAGPTPSATDRLFSLEGDGVIRNDGAGTVHFTNDEALAVGGGTHTLTLTGTNTGANSFAPLISDGAGTLALAKTGDGTWLLRGANTHTGGTTVSDGTLVTGHTSALGAGTVTVAGATATLRIGDGTSNTVTLAPGARLVVADGATLALGAANAQVALGAGGAYDFTGGSIDLNHYFDDTPTVTDYHLITGGTGGAGTAAITGYDHAMFTSVNLDGQGYLHFTAIPEPSTYGLAGAGLLTGLAAVRRRRRAA